MKKQNKRAARRQQRDNRQKLIAVRKRRDNGQKPIAVRERSHEETKAKEALRNRLIAMMDAGDLVVGQGAPASVLDRDSLVDMILDRKEAKLFLEGGTDSDGRRRQTIFRYPSKRIPMAQAIVPQLHFGTPGSMLAQEMSRARQSGNFSQPDMTDDVRDGDVDFFRSNPHRIVRIRPSVLAEYRSRMLPAGHVARTVVIDVEPMMGMRVRLIYMVRSDYPSAVLPETDGEAVKILEDLSERRLAYIIENDPERYTDMDAIAAALKRQVERKSRTNSPESDV